MRVIKKFLKILLLLHVLYSTYGEVEVEHDNRIGSTTGSNPEGALAVVKAKYTGLTPKGRFIAMAAVGFIGSRLVMDLAVTSLKVAGVVFIV